MDQAAGQHVQAVLVYLTSSPHMPNQPCSILWGAQASQSHCCHIHVGIGSNSTSIPRSVPVIAAAGLHWCLRPGREDGSLIWGGRLTATTQNLHETLKITFHNTAARCHDNSIRTPWPVEGTPHLPWPLGSHSASASPLSAHPATSVSTLAQRISSSLHRDTARATFLRCDRLVASRDSPPSRRGTT